VCNCQAGLIKAISIIIIIIIIIFRLADHWLIQENVLLNRHRLCTRVKSFQNHKNARLESNQLQAQTALWRVSLQVNGSHTHILIIFFSDCHHEPQDNLRFYIKNHSFTTTLIYVSMHLYTVSAFSTSQHRMLSQWNN